MMISLRFVAGKTVFSWLKMRRFNIELKLMRLTGEFTKFYLVFEFLS